MPVNGRSGYKDKMEPETNTQTTQIPRNPGQKQLYVIYIQDENKFSNIIKLC